MKRLRKWLLIMVIVGLVLDSFNLGRSDQPQNADVIIVLAGGLDSGRMKKAAALYKAGYADKVLMTKVIENKYYYQNIELANQFGIPTSDILPEYKAESTYDNARYSLAIMKEHDMHSALIVTSDYHIKRTRLVFDREGEDYDLSYIAALTSDGKRWYEADTAINMWFNELMKNWMYRAYLYQLMDKKGFKN